MTAAELRPVAAAELRPVTAAELRPARGWAPTAEGDVDLRVGMARRLRSWAVVHARSLVTLAVLLPGIAVLHAWNMYRSPAINITDDEGTYVSQAWAVGAWHELAHYTYWYDHPPLGWIQIAGYAWTTGAWSRAPYSVAAGREFMLVLDVAACALLYVLARRLSLHRWAAALAVLLFAASPLSLHFHRMVWLDNIAVVWILAALALAASPRRSLVSAVGSAGCLAVAVLSKETTVVLAPCVGYLLWQHSDVLTRRYRMAAFATTAGALTFFYPLYAMLKDELLEGPGHVSLIWAVRWQLGLRDPNGSIFSPGSGAAGYFHSWLDLDPWLLAAGVVLAVPALAVRRLRPPAVALLLELVLMLRPGYLPEPYVIAMLPFAALVIAGLADQLVRLGSSVRMARLGRALAAVVVMAAAVALAPVWVRADGAQLREGSPVESAQAVAWVREHVAGDQRIVVDDNVWLDLVRSGYDPERPYSSIIWVYKIGADPSVRLPSGTNAVDYFVYAMDPIYAARDVPQIVAPYRHSKIVATFGSGDNRITVRKVVH